MSEFDKLAASIRQVLMDNAATTTYIEDLTEELAYSVHRSFIQATDLAELQRKLRQITSNNEIEIEQVRHRLQQRVVLDKDIHEAQS